MSTTTAQGIVWVCQDCMLAHANGDEPMDRPADEPEVWALWADEPAGSVTMGIGTDEHNDGCEGDWEQGCYCEHDSFSTRRCGGCGSWLAGDRYAFTYWA